jgi:hypothetical protein
MAEILRSLNREWSAIADSPSARRALMRWSSTFAGAHVSRGPRRRDRSSASTPTMDPRFAGRSPSWRPPTISPPGPFSRGCSAVCATLPTESGETMTRSTTSCDSPGSESAPTPSADPDRCRPTSCSMFASAIAVSRTRPGVRSLRVWQPRRRQRRSSSSSQALPRGARHSASSSSGISEEVLATILRSRVGGESMADLAAEQQVTLKVLWHRRWRAEGRLRELPLAS